MKKILSFFAFAAITVSLTSCMKAEKVYGKTITRQERVNSFDNINLEASCQVVFTQDSACNVKVIGPEKVLSGLTIKSNGNTLVINKDNESLFNNIIDVRGLDKRITVYVSSPRLKNVKMNASNSFVTQNAVTTDSLQFFISGNGSVKMKQVNANKLFTCLIKGNGSLDIEQVRTPYYNLDIRGNGSAEGGVEGATQTHLNIRGNGDVDLNLSRCTYVYAGINGNGDVNLSGNVVSFKSDVNGVGDINTDKLNIKNK